MSTHRCCLDDPDGGVLTFTAEEWAALVAWVKAGAFGRPPLVLQEARRDHRP